MYYLPVFVFSCKEISFILFFSAMESYVTPPPCDLRYYDKLMSNVPVESESVPLILDCLLEQVKYVYQKE